MFLVACFDVSEDKVRRRIVKTLLGFGWRVQHSVFELHLRPDQFKKLKRKCETLLQQGDKIAWYTLCGKDIALRKVDGMGVVVWPEQWCLVDDTD